MKPAGVVEAYTTKISYCLLLLKISENSMAIEKTYFSESRKSLSRQLLFQFFLFRFHFVSPLYYSDCCYNKYPVKQTSILVAGVTFENCIFSVFLTYLFLNILLKIKIKQNPGCPHKKYNAIFEHKHFPQPCRDFHLKIKP